MDRQKGINDRNDKNDLFISSQIMLVVSYTIFSAILITESILLGWETWALILIGLGVAVSWYIHIKRSGSARLRLWIVSALMMATFFFYGSHETSTFDLAIVISAVIFLYTMTGIYPLITLCQVTYYITMAYETVQLAIHKTVFDTLTASRIVLHLAMVTMVCWISRVIIDKWNDVLGQSMEEISMLTMATERLGDFLANISHEIRTPINAILGLCTMGIESEKDVSKRERLESIEGAGKRIGEQISDILDFSEIDRHDLTNNCDDYMLSSVLNDIVNELGPYMKDKVELIIDVEPSIPSVMNTDVGKLKKILWHLITNGLKFTNEGGVYVHISCVPHDYGINLCIEVSDTGIGMDAAELEMIYDKFYRADTGRARITGGLGLGMPIVHGFVRSLGGFMIVESTAGYGTTIRVSIPNKVVDDEVCMSVASREDISLGAYLHFEKYSNPNVREFYDSMIRNMVTGLKVTMHRVENAEALRALISNKKLTHLFVGPEEYTDAAEYLEDLSRNIIVIVVANPGDVSISPGSHIRLMPKPFYCFPVIGVLNSKADDKPSEEGRPTFPGARVLVVDDEPMNLIVSTGMFRRYGMAVTTCGSGPEAIELCQANEYDVIFMDHMMPVMDGVEAMKRIRSDQGRRGKRIPMIAFTANAMSSAREMFRKEGFDGFVSKPVDRVELERVLRHVLPEALTVMVKDDAYSAGAEPIQKRDDMTPEEGPLPGDAASRLAEMGADIKQALYYCQGDEAFYDTLLNQYQDESFSKKDSMKKALAADDLAAYAIQVHSIKSTSKMIGVMELSEKARLLEEAAKRGDRAYVDRAHKDMLAMYDAVLNAIGPGGDGAGSDEEDVLEFDPATSREGGVR